MSSARLRLYRQPAVPFSTMSNVNSATRFARTLLILALSLGAPPSALGGTDLNVIPAGGCTDRLTVCATIRQSEGRAAIVSGREVQQLSLKSVQRASVWPAAVLVAIVSPITREQSPALASGHLLIRTARWFTAKASRAPPLST